MIIWVFTLLDYNPNNQNCTFTSVFVDCAQLVLPIFLRLFPGFIWGLKMMSDASDMLAAALEQMDGIIAGQVQN